MKALSLEPSAANSYSTATMARRLGVSVPTVQRWVDSGSLKAWKTVGGHRRIDAASAETFIRCHARQVGAAREPGGEPGAPSVLIVDDNPIDRALLMAIAEQALPGALISEAESGFEALLAIGQAPPDVLVSDIMMPHMDGFEMLRRVARMGALRPRLMVAVSSLSASDLAGRGTLPPGVQWAAKSAEPGILIELLREGLAARVGGAA